MLSIYAGIFLISMAALLLEISLTRTFSVAKWYHFAFMVVSIALLGYGASGSFLSVFPRLLTRNINQLLVVFSALFSLSCIIGFMVTNQIPFDPFGMIWIPSQISSILVHYVFLAIPFFCAGVCIGAAISKMTANVSKLYFFDLVGAGMGSIMVLGVFTLMGPRAIIVAALLGALASFLFSLGTSKKHMAVTLVMLMLIVTLPVAAPQHFEINSSPYKGLNLALRYSGSKVLSTEWNAFSKVDVVQSDGIRYAPGLSYEYRKPVPEQLGVMLDDDSAGAITHWDGNLSDISFTAFTPMSLAYELEDVQNALIIGSDGGLSVLTALYNNATNVTVVEQNPLIVDAVNHFGEFAGNIYQDARVHVKVDDGRSFIRRSNTKYDVIQLSLPSNVIASSAGIYGISENYVYTTEAFEDYLAHLSPNGMLSITGWMMFPPRQSIRTVSLAIAALERQGVDDAAAHIAAIRTWTTVTLIVKKSEFTPGDVARIKEFCNRNKFDIIYAQNITASEVNYHNRFPEPYYYQAVSALLSGNRAELYDEYLFDVSPVYDDRPFFSNFFKWSKLVGLYESMGQKWEPFFEGGFLFLLIFAQASILGAVFIFLPVYSFRRAEPKMGGRRMLTYFFLLGMGYMFIEISLIQRFILFLGQPTYAISIVLASLLVGSGIGSLTSSRLGIEKPKALALVIVVLSSAVLVYLIGLPYLFNMVLAQPFLTRSLVSIILLGALGFMMGMPFPLGIRITNELGSELIPWAWCSNGCASVLSSVMAVLIATSLGFSIVLIGAVIAYMGGLGMVVWVYGDVL